MKKDCRLISILLLFSCMIFLLSCSSNRMNASYIMINDQFSYSGEVIISNKEIVKEVANNFFKLKFNEISSKEWEQNFTNMDITLTFYNKYNIYVGKTEFYFVLKNGKVAYFDNNKYYMSIGEVDYQKIIDIKDSRY